MKWLETRLPPVSVFLISLLLAWFWSPGLREQLRVVPPARLALAITLVAAGIVLAVISVLSFRRSRTSVDPLRPDKVSSIVTTGVYAWSRNPMYLAMLLMLAAFVVFMWQAHGILIVLGFIAYLTRFQIIPEERVLARKFPEEFGRYRERVRRWI